MKARISSLREAVRMQMQQVRRLRITRQPRLEEGSPDSQNDSQGAPEADGAPTGNDNSAAGSSAAQEG